MGASTRSEIAYARAHGKRVRYLEPRTPVLESFYPAAPKDFDALWKLYADVCDQAAHDAYSPQWELDLYPTANDLQGYLDEGTMYVGRVGGELRAAMVFQPHDNPLYEQVPWHTPAEYDEVATIHMLAVHPSLRGRHVGAELVDEALRLAYEQGKRAIHLDVIRDNLAASRIYEAAGFRVVGTRTRVFDDKSTLEFQIYEYSL